MGLFRPDRSRPPGEDPFLIWKVRFFVIGGGLGIGGMVMELPWMLWTGVAILAVGWILRFRSLEAGRAAVSWPDGEEDEAPAEEGMEDRFRQGEDLPREGDPGKGNGFRNDGEDAAAG